MKTILIFYFLWVSFVHAQNHGNLWFWGDSIGLNFNHNPPSPFFSPVISPKFNIGVLCDSLGALLYYDHTISSHPDTGVAVFDRNKNLIYMPNGTKGNQQSYSWFLPFPSSNVTGYLVSLTSLNNLNYFGFNELYFSRLNNSLRNSMGDWLGLTNMPISIRDSLKSGGAMNVGINQHANGRDWWIIGKKHSDDSLLVWLASPDSVYNVYRKKIGSINCTGNISPTAGANTGGLVFNSTGNKLLHVNGEGLVEIFDFNRCEGLLYNPVTLDSTLINPSNSASFRAMYSADFSPSGRYVYACQYDFVNNHYYLVQYDIEGSSPGFNKTTIFNQTMNQALATRGFVSVTRGLDNRMYLVPRCLGGGSCFPIDSTCLSTIEYPDVGGLGCGLTLNKICYNQELYSGVLSLAPNYDLGPIDGSICDTLGIDVRVDTPNVRNLLNEEINVHVYPNPVRYSLTLEVPRSIQILSYQIYDLQGKLCMESILEHPTNCISIDMKSLLPGYYIAEIQTSHGVFQKKVVRLEY